MEPIFAEENMWQCFFGQNRNKFCQICRGFCPLFGHLTDSISPSAPSGVLNSPSRGQMFDMMPRTTSFLSRLSTIPMVRPICVRATITRNKEFMLVCDFKGGRKRNRMMLLRGGPGGDSCSWRVA